MENKELRSKIMEYSFYDETHKLIAKLNIEKLRVLLGVDDVILNENVHK